MKRISLLTLVFAFLSLVFITLLVFLRFKFPPYPLVSYQDVFDILTPLALIPVYWLLFKYAGGDLPSLTEEIVFFVFAALWVEGQGMHLSANSIDNLIDALARNQVFNIKPSDIYSLTYFFDEHLGHYLWHIGMIGLAVLLVYREWRRPAGATTTWWQAILAGIIYGFTYFCIFIEGQSVALGLPFAVIGLAFALLVGRKKLGQRPVLAFFFVVCLLAFVLFTGWGLYWGGFPQFSDVGLL
ncbi:MAG: hypothetical protein ABSE06_18020 [Anaerolineaceae bacterium]|jgi:hypothetical protein